MPDPVARVMLTVRLRQYEDSGGPRALPADITEAALANTLRRLVLYEDGQLMLTTLFRTPGDPDSDVIESVGGAVRIERVEIQRG